MACQFSIKKFDSLSSIDVYYILQARAQVFIIEQKIIQQDIDEVDFDSLHLVAHKDATLIGYTRIKPSMVDDETEPKKAKLKAPIELDKVLMLPDHRGYGIAHKMLLQAIKYCREHFPKRNIKVSIPTKLAEFYSPLGFEITSKPYSKNGAEHIDMTLDPRKKTKTQIDTLAFPQVLSILLILLGLVFIAGLLYLMPA